MPRRSTVVTKQLPAIVLILVSFMSATALAQSAGVNHPLSIDTEVIPEALLDSNTTQGESVEQASWQESVQRGDGDLLNSLSSEAEKLLSREGTDSSIKAVLLIGALSLAPAILLMTTCYIRIIVVLSLLRQAFGSQQLPPTQILTALSLFLTLLVMTPVWKQVKQEVNQEEIEQ